MTFFLYKLDCLASLNFDYFNLLSLFTISSNSQHFCRKLNRDKEIEPIENSHTNNLYWLHKSISSLFLQMRNTVSFMFGPVSESERKIRHNFHNIFITDPLLI
jgi:hypothetical protein